MKKLFLALLLCTSCSGGKRLTVYRVEPLKGGKTIEVINTFSVNKVGDTVLVNLSDSEIDSVGTPYIIKSIYESKKH